MESAPDLQTALAVLRNVGVRFQTDSDDVLLTDIEQVEAIGRLADSWRIAVAAEAAKRSHKRYGENRISFKNGARDGAELVAQTARIGYGTARRRVGLGSAVAPKVSLTAELLPGRYPTMAEAVESGQVGLDSARVVVTMLQQVRKRLKQTFTSRAVIDDAIAKAELELTRSAKATSTEELKLIAEVWRAWLDPDGAEPTTEDARRARAFRLGALRSDGTATFTGTIAGAEHYALFKELFDSRRRVGPFSRTPDGGDDDHEDLDGQWRKDGDERTRVQQDYDTLIDVLVAGTAAEHAGAAASATTHEIVIHTTAQDLEDHEGSGWTSGILGRIPMPTVEKIACTAGIRLLVTDDTGEPLHLGHSQRLFSAAQRKALTARAGGRCEIPGCTVPHPFLQAHHVNWVKRDDGKTDIENGIMVCSYHHHLIHATNAPLELRTENGHVHVVPRRYRGPLQARHRIQHGPHIDIGRRRDDPSNRYFRSS